METVWVVKVRILVAFGDFAYSCTKVTLKREEVW
jgi:hypothetical protein